MRSPQFEVGPEEVVFVRTVGFRRVVDDLDSQEWLLAGNRAPPRRAKEPVLIEKYCEALAAVSQTSRPFVVFTGRNVFPDSEFIQFKNKAW